MDGPVENTGALITRSVNSRAGLTQVSSVEHKSQDTTQSRNSWESGNKGSFSVFPGLDPAKNVVSNSSQTGATGNPHLDGGSSSPKWISCLIWSHFPGEPKEGCRWELRLITSAGYDLCSSESPAPLCRSLGWTNIGAEFPTTTIRKLRPHSPGPLAYTPRPSLIL